MKQFSFWLRILALAPIAILLTLATGELHTNGWGYGLPLPWKRDLAGDCPTFFFGPPCPLVHSGFLVYNWFFFALDVLFYMAIEHTLLLTLRKFRHPSTPSPGAQ